MSPLSWQIRNLVEGLGGKKKGSSKSKAKSTVKELRHLVQLFGVEAKVQLLSCLMGDLEFSDKNDPKLETLVQELKDSWDRDDFSSTTRAAFETLTPKNHDQKKIENFLLKKAHGLTLIQRIALGSALSQSAVPALAQAGVHIVQKLIQAIANSSALQDYDSNAKDIDTVSISTVHQILSLLRSDKAFDEASLETFLSAFPKARQGEHIVFVRNCGIHAEEVD